MAKRMYFVDGVMTFFTGYVKWQEERELMRMWREKEQSIRGFSAV